MRYDWLVRQVSSGVHIHQIWDTKTGRMVWCGQPHLLRRQAITCVATRCMEMNLDDRSTAGAAVQEAAEACSCA